MGPFSLLECTSLIKASLSIEKFGEKSHRPGVDSIKTNWNWIFVEWQNCWKKYTPLLVWSGGDVFDICCKWYMFFFWDTCLTHPSKIMRLRYIPGLIWLWKTTTFGWFQQHICNFSPLEAELHTFHLLGELFLSPKLSEGLCQTSGVSKWNLGVDNQMNTP